LTGILIVSSAMIRHHSLTGSPQSEAALWISNQSSWVTRKLITLVTRLGEAGFDAFTIASLMGHSNVKTTQRYVRATELNKRAAVQQRTLATREQKAATIVAVSA
jgi:integrase